MTSYLGDFNPSDVFSTKFCTVTSSGAPDTFTTSPAVVIYKDNGTTPVATGVTLNTNFNSVTGLNNLTIDTSTSAGFYASGHDFMAVISAGTAGGVNIAGYVVAEFSIQHRSPLRPTTASRTLNVSAGGLADANVIQINSITASAVTTVNANIGTTQPINFTGTGGSAWINVEVEDVVTASMNAISDNLLNRDMSAGLDSGNQTFRTPRQAFRAVRNKNDISDGANEKVYKEDDITLSWTQPITGATSSIPIVKVGP